MAHAIVTPAVRGLLAEQHQLLLTVADLVDPAGALLDLQHERRTVLERGVAPLDAAGWALAAACIRLWGGCRQAPQLAEGLDGESAAVALSLLVLARQRWPQDAGWAEADAAAEARAAEAEAEARAEYAQRLRAAKQRRAVAEGLEQRPRERVRQRRRPRSAASGGGGGGARSGAVIRKGA